jgi:hypothetical protein
MRSVALRNGISFLMVPVFLFYAVEPAYAEGPTRETGETRERGRPHALAEDERAQLTMISVLSRLLLFQRAGLSGKGGESFSDGERSALAALNEESGDLSRMKGGDSFDIYNRYKKPRTHPLVIIGKVIGVIILVALGLGLVVGVVLLAAAGSRSRGTSGGLIPPISQ